MYNLKTLSIESLWFFWGRGERGKKQDSCKDFHFLHLFNCVCTCTLTWKHFWLFENFKACTSYVIVICVDVKLTSKARMKVRRIVEYCDDVLLLCRLSLFFFFLVFIRISGWQTWKLLVCSQKCLPIVYSLSPMQQQPGRVTMVIRVYHTCIQSTHVTYVRSWVSSNQHTNVKYWWYLKKYVYIVC